MIKIAIFASGQGSNAAKIIQHFSKNKAIVVDCIFTNRKHAGVIEHAYAANIPCFYFENQIFGDGIKPLKVLRERNVDWLVLAGFLKKIPRNILQAFPNKIINLHPSLLPKFGGKGMYGEHVHRAVIAAGEKTSGISIHLVNENFDEGKLIFQKSCPVEPNDTPKDLGKKIQKLEHNYFPQVIESEIMKSFACQESKLGQFER